MVYEYIMTSGRKWAHEAKFEMEWFRAYFGPDVLYKAEWGDTLGQAHVIDERPAKELDELTQLHFGIRLKDFSNVDLKNMEAEPLEKILPLQRRGREVLPRAVDHSGRHSGTVEPRLLGMYHKLHSATPALVQMQAKGVVRDPKAIETLDADLDKQERELESKIAKQRDVLEFIKVSGKFNPASNKDLPGFFRDFLKIPHPYARKKESSYSCDEEALSMMRHPVAKLILEWRGVGKRRDYVTPLFDAAPGRVTREACLGRWAGPRVL
jgi:DNA polymerase I-like protein with 3'-5' exonuclease and polymerase domains